jgi:Holliday junction DNA helicase RuvB
VSEVAQREKLFRLLSANPEVRRIVARALEVEQEGRAKHDYYLGWEWHEIPVPAQKLRVLVEERVIKVSYHSRSSTMYQVEDPEQAKEALAAIGDETQEVEEGTIPDNLFDHIVGHEEVKHWIGKSLASATPVHILLVGPPATAKSMFLEGLGSLPGSQYALGGSSSRAGIADFLLNFRPRYLVIDELDKMKAEDFSVFLSLMQSGVVARLKKGMREVEHMTSWVFAGCNKRDRLPPELLSRFVEFQLTPYTREEFVEVAGAVITGPLGKDQDLARYIAERVSRRTRDVRQAIHVAQLCDSQEEVDRFESGAEPGRIL